MTVEELEHTIIDYSSCPLNQWEKEYRGNLADYEHFEEYIPRRLSGKVLENKSTKLYLQTWKPKGELTGHILYSHGLNDYGGRFVRFAHHFLSKGFMMSMVDMPGHGRSSGTRGLVNSIKEEAQVTSLALCRISETDYPLTCGLSEKRYFLLGPSMGGLVCLSTLVLSEVLPDELAPFDWSLLKAVSCLAPLIQVHRETKPNYAVELVGRLIRNIYPALPVSPANRGLNHKDPAVEEEFTADPGTYSGYLRVGTGFAMLEGLEYLAANYDKVKKPVQFIHGTDDKVTDPAGTEEFYEKISCDKQLILVENGDHVLWFGAKTDNTLFDDIIEWFNKH